ncbi:hypothetical protein GCM10010441_29330 [Kitasatospora paracochleata]|uniref:Uncharacterized protein n=1 Tax=Kitasatospora paracochleata TaxID=58354 RepID=A0ABT1J9L5_9ACTN|nr:hypothetical protein [Kitasatospora paracochleata]MCP2313894.1 hypothetical protein [Kitasatospora paracochleata]
MEISPTWEKLSSRFAALGEQIAAALNTLEPEERRGWTHRRENNAYGSVALLHPAGWQLHIWREKAHCTGAAGQRLTISGIVPSEYRGRAEHRITVAGDRPPGDIARDIARRLLPGYRDTAAKAFEHRDQEQAATRARVAAFARLREALPALNTGASSIESGYGLFYRGYARVADGQGGARESGHRAHASGTVRLSHDGSTGSIKADEVPLELLVEFLARLNADPQALTGRVMPRLLDSALPELGWRPRVVPGEVVTGEPAGSGEQRQTLPAAGTEAKPITPADVPMI